MMEKKNTHNSNRMDLRQAMVHPDVYWHYICKSGKINKILQLNASYGQQCTADVQ